MTTKTRTKHPGITKITYTSGEVRYRLIITVGKRPDNREIQECHTFRTTTGALKKQAEIRDARDKGKFVKRDSVTFDVLCQRWPQLGPKRVQDLSRTDIEKVIKKARAAEPLPQHDRAHVGGCSAGARLRDQLQPALRQRGRERQASPEAAQHRSR
jgi:hypothetical protein